MRVSKILEFLSALGCEKISVGSKWVRSTCPLQHRHSGGKDTNPSFGIAISVGDKSGCRCFGCGISGDPIGLLWRMSVEGLSIDSNLLWFLMEHNKVDVEKWPDEPVMSSVDGSENELPELTVSSLEENIKACKKYIPSHERRKRKSRFVYPEDAPQAEVPEDILKQMVCDLPDKVMAYLTRSPNKVLGIRGRGLDRLTVGEWELGWHPLRQRICIPIRDESGKLVAVSGRLFDDDKNKRLGPKYLHSRFKRDRVLFGEHFHDSSNRVGYLFEGFFQVIYAWHIGYKNVFARMGTHLSQLQAEKLVRWCDRLVIVPDGDRPGIDAANRDAMWLRDLEVFDKSGKVFKISEVIVVDMPHGEDADSLKPKQLRELLGSRFIS